MKIKDIKKQLKQESGDMTPDVLDRVKISPINRLRQNEKAMRVFKQTIASLILLILAAIVIILSVSIYAYMTQKPDTAEENYTFVSVWINSGSEDTDLSDGLSSTDSAIISFVVDGDGQVVFAYNETAGTVLPSPGYIGNAVSLLNGDGATAVYVMATSDRPAFQRNCYNELKTTIADSGVFGDTPVNYHIGDSLSRFMMGTSINSLKGFDHDRFVEAESVNDLCALYVEFAS